MISHYGFNKFSYKSFGNKGDLIKTINIDKGTKKTIGIVLENNVGVLIEKGKDSEISQNMQLNENISAPIMVGQKLGELSFELNGEILNTVNLVSNTTVDKINIFTMTKNIIYSWVDLLRS